jgi:hypothetical protein
MAYPTSPTNGQIFKNKVYAGDRWQDKKFVMLPNDHIIRHSFENMPLFPDNPTGQLATFSLSDFTAYGTSAINLNSYKGKTLKIKALASKGTSQGAGYPRLYLYKTDWTWAWNAGWEYSSPTFAEYEIAIPSIAGDIVANWYHFPNASSGNSSVFQSYYGDANYNKISVDSDGKANGITYNGVSRTEGLDGNAISFFDNKSFVDIDAPQLLTGSISLWFKSKATSNGSYVFSDQSNKLNYLFIGDATGAYTDESMSFLMHNGSTNTGLLNIRKGQSFYMDDQWHHVALIIDGVDNRVYVDGQLQTLAWQAGSKTSTGLLRGGVQLGSNGSSPLDGAIDDFRIFTKSLTVSDVDALYKYRRNSIYAS